MRVLVLGAGIMGAQVGCEYALGGHEVTLTARHLDRIERRGKFGAPTGCLRVGADLGRIRHFEFVRSGALLGEPLLERGIGHEPADFRPGTDGKLASVLPLQL